MPFEASYYQRKLGAELQKARLGEELSARQVADGLDWAVTKITRIERAEVKCSTADIITLAKRYGLADREVDQLCEMGRMGRTNMWWKNFRRWLSDDLYDLIGYENDASSMMSLLASVVDGLLQTPAYMAGLMEASQMIRDPDRITALLEVRRLRQKRLFESVPLEVDVTMDESILSIPYGGRDVLQGQLRYLRELSELPNVTIRVLPTTVAAERVPLNVYSFGGSDAPAIASFDATFAVIVRDDPLDVSAARRVLQAAQRKSLAPEASMACIDEKIKELQQ